MADYFSFEDVLGELALDEDELKRMVSEGELRAFRDENKMKFRKDDVESLKKGRVTEPTIILPAGGGRSAPKQADTGETILDMDNVSSGGVDETALPQLDGGSQGNDKEETVSGDTTGITEEMIFDDSDLTVANEGPKSGGMETEETFIEGEGKTGLTTEPLQFDEAAEGAATVQEPSVKPSKRSGLQDSVQPAQRGGAMMVAVSPIQSHPVLTAVLCLSAVFLGLMGAVLLDNIRIVTDKDEARINKPSEFAGGLAKTVVGTFGFKEIETDLNNLMTGKTPAPAPAK
ncbi:MAG: hypothetical protein K8T20_10245 [Planctomycetes bacterium]|nr:hypothetical protein [Planctomycetota bacterium]